MASTTTYPDDSAPAKLLRYLPEYQVVICTGCHYAVQPTAISRHLKEIHRVLRSRRRKYDQYVAGLRLRDPQDVKPPSEPERFPVPCLPVEPGFRCREPECNHLCVTSKRMKAHWRNNHGRKANPEQDYTSTPLQTFFRGNLLQYFTRPATLVPNRNNVALSHTHLSHTDTDLLTHYLTTTHRTFITGPETTDVWSNAIPTLAFQHPFLLHGLLACTALHKAYLSKCNPQAAKQYRFLAYSHQALALPEFRAAVEDPTEDNCCAILAFAHLLIIYSFGSSSTGSNDPDSDCLFLTSTAKPKLTHPQDGNENGTDYGNINALPNWLFFIRGSCSVLSNTMHHIKSGPLHPLIDAWALRPRETEDTYTTLLRHLLSVISSSSFPSQLTPPPGNTINLGDDAVHLDFWPESVVQIYTTAAKQLNTSFLYLRHYKPTEITAWNVLRVWPVVVSLDFINLLQQEHPGALILLAHYCILLKYMERYWYFEKRAEILIWRIWSRLRNGWRGYIQGAMEGVLGGGDPGFWVEEIQVESKAGITGN
ncbi:hypothetical protein BDW72DRAFT_213984 [Aspergillus terricola var. indicus]